jgi:DNA-3-methyladenine glycosylase
MHRQAVPELLPRSFYAPDAATVARALLGQVLVHRHAEGEQRVRIVETEAYLGTADRACHAFAGPTPRNRVMYGPPGHAYVYLIYGLHDMLNVVVAGEGDPQAVLLRAAEPVANVAAALNGPGRLCRALGITRALNGVDLCGPILFLERGAPPAAIRVTPRIGVAYAGAWAAAPLRFCDARSRHLSKARPDRPPGR